MKESKTNTRFKTFRKIIFRTLIVLILLLLVTVIALTLPSVQTKIAQYYTEKINKQYKTNITVEQVAITVFGSVKLKKVLIKDHHNDTLIFSNKITTSVLDSKKLLDGNLLFGTMRVDGLLLNIKTYKNEKNNNLNKFVAAFDTKNKPKHKFLMTSKKITLTNSHLLVTDENSLNSKSVDFTKLNSVITNFKIYGPDINATIDEMSFKDHRGLTVKNLKSKFTYTKTNIKLEDLDLETENSKFIGSAILKYDAKSFSDFNNKVTLDISIKSALISTNDIRYLYKDIAKDQVFNLNAKIDGTLNNLTLKKLDLLDSKGSHIVGDVVLKNLLAKKGKGDFYMKGSFDKISSSYDNLTALLPNVLAKKIPSSLKKLGKFNLVGDAEITTTFIDADFSLSTVLGNVKSKLLMTNINTIDTASYNGRIALDNFDIGTFLNRKDIGKVTIDVDVDGKGFTEKYLNTKFSGEIESVKYNGYTYKNIIADGSFKKPIFTGNVSINDTNLFLDFNGTIDLSNKESIYDFKAKVDYANLKNLNFLNDEISVFKGDVDMKVKGSSIDNLKGEVVFSNASYQNKKDTYFFDNVTVSSQFDANNERTINIISPNAINAKIVGKYDFSQIQKMVQNSLGSLYTNYKSDNVKKGQYIKFKLSEFNKIIEIFYPKINIDSTTTISGSINSDDNDFKLNLSSKKINAFNATFDNLLVEVDNKNPLYNTYVQIDSIKTKLYKVRDFSLINVTSKDTLSFRTEFKGGEKGNDAYNLNLYHTINKDNQNIVGFNKSEMMFKDFIWYINEKEDDKNKVVFDKSFKNFNFEDIVITHENQSINLKGVLNGTNTKDIELTFNNVELNKITPNVKKFKFDGNLNGTVFLKQNNAVYQPTASLQIKDLFINENQLGNLILDIEGDENFRKFTLNSEIENENFKSFKATGGLEIVNDQTILDVNLNFQKFNLGVLSNLGAGVLSNIRGFVSGNARIDGNIKNIDYNGRLFADEVGLTIPYLNVDYVLKPNSIIDVTQNKFIIQPTQITDSKFNTNGNLEGFIKHKQFGEWELDLEIDADRLLALDTKDYEDAAYFGTAFIKGNATIKGPTNGLFIKVKAASEKGTDIKIPINDATAVSDNNYIHFVTANEKLNKNLPNAVPRKSYNGLEMRFEFDITQDASIEVILDREGHGMRGKGRGELLFEINTGGKFTMFGDYQVYEGKYNFKYGGLIDKKFDVKKFSSIVWEGDPLKAVLNLEAVYNTTANPAVLVANSSFNKKIPVQVIIGVKGTIKNPEPEFNILFPEGSSILKSEIETKLNDKDIRQTQALHLLAFGGFLSQDGLSQSQPTNILFERASSLFGDLFQDADGKLQVNLIYNQANRTPGTETNGEFGVTVSSKINDRITINGKVGVPVGGVNESAIVENVEIQYRVYEDGTLNLRLFNRENEINYLGQGVGYTQGVGVSYEVDFSTFRELVNKIFKKNKIDVVKPKAKNEDDSSLLPDFIKMENEKKSKEKSKEEVKNNKEAIPIED